MTCNLKKSRAVYFAPDGGRDDVLDRNIRIVIGESGPSNEVVVVTDRDLPDARAAYRTVGAVPLFANGVLVITVIDGENVPVDANVVQVFTKYVSTPVDSIVFIPGPSQSRAARHPDLSAHTQGAIDDTARYNGHCINVLAAVPELTIAGGGAINSIVVASLILDVPVKSVKLGLVMLKIFRAHDRINVSGGLHVSRDRIGYDMMINSTDEIRAHDVSGPVRVRPAAAIVVREPSAYYLKLFSLC